MKNSLLKKLVFILFLLSSILAFSQEKRNCGTNNRNDYLNKINPENIEKQNAFELIQNTGKQKIGILGLSFKAGTDDLRHSPIVEIIEKLYGKGYDIKIYDKNVVLARLVGKNKSFIEEKLPPSIPVNGIDLFPAKSIMVGKRSDPETGIADSEPFLIPGPAMTNGIRTPPSNASHLPLVKG